MSQFQENISQNLMLKLFLFHNYIHLYLLVETSQLLNVCKQNLKFTHNSFLEIEILKSNEMLYQTLFPYIFTENTFCQIYEIRNLSDFSLIITKTS